MLAARCRLFVALAATRMASSQCGEYCLAVLLKNGLSHIRRLMLGGVDRQHGPCCAEVVMKDAPDACAPRSPGKAAVAARASYPEGGARCRGQCLRRRRRAPPSWPPSKVACGTGPARGRAARGLQEGVRHGAAGGGEGLLCISSSAAEHAIRRSPTGY
eukprot:361160-Chlamydomonas_euryale.AAC.3